LTGYLWNTVQIVSPLVKSLMPENTYLIMSTSEHLKFRLITLSYTQSFIIHWHGWPHCNI